MLTERRLRPLTQLTDAGAQVAGFRQLLRRHRHPDGRPRIDSPLTTG